MGAIKPARPDDDAESTRRLETAAWGDRAACGAVLEQHRELLRRMVALRLDRRLQGRVDPTDVIQDAYVEATRRLLEYGAPRNREPHRGVRPGVPGGVD